VANIHPSTTFQSPVTLIFRVVGVFRGSKLVPGVMKSSELTQDAVSHLLPPVVYDHLCTLAPLQVWTPALRTKADLLRNQSAEISD
jgi:hypothetical protein